MTQIDPQIIDGRDKPILLCLYYDRMGIVAAARAVYHAAMAVFSEHAFCR
jgi:hypothetical protein